jgi:hypothetical protein
LAEIVTMFEQAGRAQGMRYLSRAPDELARVLADCGL